MKIKLIGISLALCLFFTAFSYSEERASGINFYTGMFDFSDDGKKQVFMALNIKTKIFIKTLFLEELLQ